MMWPRLDPSGRAPDAHRTPRPRRDGGDNSSDNAVDHVSIDLVGVLL